MPLDPLDPRPLSLSVEQRSADKFASVNRQLGHLQRQSLNRVIAMARIVGGSMTVPNNNTVVASFSSADFDTGGMWNPAAGDRLTITASGVYMVSAGAQFGANTASGYRRLTVVTPGGAWLINPPALDNVAGDGAAWLRVSDVLQLTAGDQLRLEGFISVNPNVSQSVAGATLAAAYIGSP